MDTNTAKRLGALMAQDETSFQLKPSVSQQMGGNEPGTNRFPTQCHMEMT